MPGIGAVTALSPGVGPCAAATESTLGGAAGGGGGWFSLHGRFQGLGVTRSGGGERGGCSVRNAVVASPVRTIGCDDEPAQEGQVGGHACDSVSRERAGEDLERLLPVCVRAR